MTKVLEAAGCLVGHNLVLGFDFRKGLQSRVRDGNAGRSRISGDRITFEMRSSKWKCIALVLEILSEVLVFTPAACTSYQQSQL